MAKILLIEPDRVLAGIYYEALVAAGHEVNVAPGAQSAIMAADRVRPDLIVIELQLVDHSGIEFLYEFKSYSEWQDIGVIILSQIPPSEFNNSSAILKNQLGMIEYLYKPHTSLQKLTSSINASLQTTEA